MINYLNLHDSTVYYEEHGYKRIEAPWTVTKAISHITKPSIAGMDYEIVGKNKVLVASGEQSFLYLYLKEFLPKGKFQAITPCFREETFDHTHTKYFMKNELIITDKVNEEELFKMVQCAFDFFKSKLEVKNLGDIHVRNYKSENDENCYDLEYHGVELGSYGIRRCEYLSWIFGTGCAEPRLSYCQNMLENLKAE